VTARRTLTWTIPGTPAQILHRLGDPDVARRRAAADPALAAEVTELATDTPDGAALVMAVTAQVPTSWVPARVAAALPAAPRIVRREVWRLTGDDAVADVAVRLEAIPATTMTTGASLRPTAPGADTSTLTYEIRLDVGIPLAGSAIERAVIEQISRGYDQEAAVIAGS